MTAKRIALYIVTALVSLWIGGIASEIILGQYSEAPHIPAYFILKWVMVVSLFLVTSSLWYRIIDNRFWTWDRPED